ncbi:hypothetical protein DICVIV_13746 [Dictyocaulus viviparus]|uniref:Uncharacterized protein n=1 Tax=Dictyocaulus viviparus TaxID=29172 RepID=A0A0D8X987_DICVI|nr:hypothetical protein DICVIV_13746 [Dictyocaulus viviparus]
MSATESMKDSDEPSYKVKSMSYAIRPDRLKQSRIRRDRHDYSEKVRNPTRHSDDDRIVSFISGEGSVKTDELSKTRYDSSTSDRRSRRAIHSGREADRNSIKSSRRRLQFDKNDLYTSSSSRAKRSKSSRSTKRRPSYSRRRRSRRYQRSRRGRINRQRKSKSMLSKKRKPRKRKEDDNRTKTERRSKRPEVVSSEKPLALQSVEEDENQPQTSPLKVLAFNEKDQLHLSTKPGITSDRGTGKSTKETTPYYTAKNTRYRTLYVSVSMKKFDFFQSIFFEVHKKDIANIA